MGIHSYSQPSSSSASLRSSDSLRSSAGATSVRQSPIRRSFGMPMTCFCGHSTVIQTSRTLLNPGRRFYSCPRAETSGEHIFKWWDEAVADEIQRLKGCFTEQYDILRALGVLDEGVLPTVSIPNLNSMRSAIQAAEEEIARLKEMLDPQAPSSPSMKLTFASAALVFVIAVLVFMLMWFFTKAT